MSDGSTHVALLWSGLGGRGVSGPEPSDWGGSGNGRPGAPGEMEIIVMNRIKSKGYLPSESCITG